MRQTPQMSIYIDRKPLDVFDYVLDIARTPEWRPRMSGAAWTDDSVVGIGSKFRVDVRMLLLRFSFEFEVTAYERGRRFGYRQLDGLVKVDAEMEWRSDGDGCRYFIGGDNATDNVLMRLATPLFRSSLLWQDYNDLIRLKRILESGTVGRA